MIADC